MRDDLGLFDGRDPDDRPPDGPRPAYGGDVPTHRGARDTERRAADKMRAWSPTLKAQTLDWVIERTTLTAKEGGEILALSRGRPACDGSSRWSVAPRLRELYLEGFVRDSGLRRDDCIAWEWTGRPASELAPGRPRKGGQAQ